MEHNEINFYRASAAKLSYLSLIVAVVATFAGYNIYQSQRVESIMSDLTMANVEALAGSEINDEDLCQCI